MYRSIQPRKHVLDHTDHAAPTRPHELDHIDHVQAHPTQKTCVRSCRSCDSHPETWSRSYRSYRSCTDHTDQEYICPEVLTSLLPDVWTRVSYCKVSPPWFQPVYRRDVDATVAVSQPYCLRAAYYFTTYSTLRMGATYSTLRMGATYSTLRMGATYSTLRMGAGHCVRYEHN